MITIQLTNSNFYDLYRDSEFVRGLSFESVDYLLEVHNEIYEDSDEAHDWTPLFMGAREYASHEFIKDYLKYADKDAIHDAYLEFDENGDSDLLMDSIIRISGENFRTKILNSGNVLVYD